jgi:hypothetical protein
MVSLEALAPAVDQACQRAEHLVQIATGHPLDVERLRTLQRRQAQERESLTRIGMSGLMTIPVTTAFLRTIQNDNVRGVKELARHHAWAYRQWRAQLSHLHRVLGAGRAGAPRQLPMRRRTSAAV